MQWDDSENAGFSSAKPWFYVNPNYRKVNVKREEKDEDSILNFYRKCLALRKSSETLLHGDYTEHYPKDNNIYMYERSLPDESFLIICSFSRLPVKAHKPAKFAGRHGELVLCNYSEKRKDASGVGLERVKNELNDLEHRKGLLRPYEVRVYRYKMK